MNESDQIKPDKEKTSDEKLREEVNELIERVFQLEMLLARFYGFSIDNTFPPAASNFIKLENEKLKNLKTMRVTRSEEVPIIEIPNWGIPKSREERERRFRK